MVVKFKTHELSECLGCNPDSYYYYCSVPVVLSNTSYIATTVTVTSVSQQYILLVNTSSVTNTALSVGQPSVVRAPDS